MVLLDVRLPDISGLEILQKFSRDSKTAKIIVTGFSTEDTGEKAADYGADEYLVKPVKAEELIKVIKELLSIQENE